LAAADMMMASHIDAVEADEIRCRYYFDHSRMIVTALVPQLGYEPCADLVKEFDTTGRENFREFLEEKLGHQIITEAFTPQNLMALGYKRHG